MFVQWMIIKWSKIISGEAEGHAREKQVNDGDLGEDGGVLL